MPFNIALSGIRAANNDLRVTGNNIANASTTGFKESRTEFGDIYSTSAIGSGLTQSGSGVRVQDVSQQFSQGNISFTENALDLSVSGSGFFVTSFNGNETYTRSGAFGLDQDGYIVNNANARLQGFSADSSGNISGLISDIQIQTDNIQPTATTGVEIALNVDSREAVIQTTGTRYISSGGSAAANVNPYTAQSLDFTNPAGATSTFTTSLSENSFDTVTDLNRLPGITAVSEATATLSAWTSGLVVTVNSAPLTNTGISQATATEISALPGLTATYDSGTASISVVSTIGDLIFEAAGSGGADQVLTLTGSTGLPQTLEFDGAGDLVTAGNLGVSGILTAGTAVIPTGLSSSGVFTGVFTASTAVIPTTLSSSGVFTANTAVVPLVQSSSGNFTAAPAAVTLVADLVGAGANDYDFTITVDGTPSAANIVLAPGTYADYDAIAAELQTQIDADGSLTGLGITVAYDTDHFVFTSPSTTGSTSTVALTAVGGSAAAGLGITIGATATAGTDADAYDFSITIDGVASAADISLPVATYADYDAIATALQTQIDADVNLTGLGITVAYDTDHFVFTSPSVTGTSSTVALTAVGGSAAVGLGITGGTATAGTSTGIYDFSITVDGLPSAADISLPVADYASYAAMATALEAAINADTNISGVSVDYDTDHFVFTSGSAGTTSTVALTAVGASAADLGIGSGTATAGVANITVGGIITMELDEGYSLVDNSGTPIFDNASINFINNAFDPTLPETFNHSTSVTIYDSLGNPHVMQQYFVKQPYDTTDASTQPNHWLMSVQIDGANIGDPVISAPTTATMATYDLFFTANGTLNEGISDSLLISNWTPTDDSGNALGALGPLNVAAGGSSPVADPAISSNFEITMPDSTQVGSEFEVRALDQNGSTTGRLVGIDVDDSGIIFARYTNGENQILAQVGLADFPNSQGLQSLGDTSWAQTFDSGEPVIGGPGTASLGLIQSGALEDSNVDLSEQLVNLIIAQRNFQASAKTIETADTITQTIINLR
ncbi:MAG: flagellar hook-basal body protein [Kiritimatiellia bacterium]|jgi:flagellar hook-basal body protein